MSGVNLTGMNLSGANLTAAFLTGVNLLFSSTDSTTICPDGNRGPCW
jgi:uncharacterized protein YjbI with pentapeptide repeats